MSITRTRRLVVLAAATLTALGLLAGPAFAHATATPSEQPSDGFGRLAIRVPHGCEGQPTEVVTVRIPDGVVSVKPEQVPGWTAETEIGAYDEPVELHGQQVTEGVQVITWTAEPGNELPDGLFREFGITAKFPAGEGPLYFPTIQTCTGGGEEAWIEIPAEGEDGHSLERPAPSVTLVASSGHGHGDDDGMDHGDDAMSQDDDGAMDHDDDEASDGEGTELASADGGSSDTLAIVALVVGALGLVVGTTGLLAARRATRA